MSDRGWIGVDLDATLAEYHGWTAPCELGEPVPVMVDRVKAWLAEGEDVRVFTARICTEVHPCGTTQGDVVNSIQAWCIEHIGQVLPISHIKDHHMRELWDDRAVQVIPNTGRAVGDCSFVSREELGRWVRESWVKYWEEHGVNPPNSWTQPWDEMNEGPFKEVDRCMGEYIVQQLRERGIIKE